MRNIGRKIAADAPRRATFALPLALARRVREQRQRQRGPKIYSLHASEVECIGKSKAHRPYEFGIKVSVVTLVWRCRGGPFVAQVAATPGNPYDSHTLAKVIPAITRQIGVSLTQIIADAAAVCVCSRRRGRAASQSRSSAICTRRAAVEPVNYLAGREGDAANPVLAAIGYNFRLLLTWLAALLRRLIAAQLCRASSDIAMQTDSALAQSA